MDIVAIRSDLHEQGQHEMAWIKVRDMNIDVVKLQQDILFHWENLRFEITDTAQGQIASNLSRREGSPCF